MLRYDPYEYIYLTKHYGCGCTTLIPILRDTYERDYPLHHAQDSRDVYLLADSCQHCTARVVRALERRMERRAAG